eukprot:TRINITY_DN1381_c0_g2_i1.p1 TRINITY_DN1381_c0_g2~~TRINITY_DN1381_c0_g2_i1.p1  ORF type:complete len:371 (+),score=101.99 TRINITY_DN1381_c0_g2_i1:2-1114(+)
MRAVLLTEYGNDDGCLTFKSDYDIIHKPLNGNEILIKVKACGLSKTDLSLKNGFFKDFATDLPKILGFEVVGVVQKIGPEATILSLGDPVVTMIPIDSQGGYCDYTIQPEHNIIKIPSPDLSNNNNNNNNENSNFGTLDNLIDMEEVVAVTGPGIRAYQALHYMCKVTQGETILILNGASSANHIAVQLASLWGCSIITTCNNDSQREYLDRLPKIGVNIAKIIDLREEDLSAVVMNETGNLGVDYILEDESIDPSNYKNDYIGFTKNDLIQSLAIHGTWVTSHYLQLDPPDSKILFLKSASVSYLFPQTWSLSQSQQGRFLNIIMDILEKIKTGVIRSNVAGIYPLSKITDVHQMLNDDNIVGKLIIKL